MSMGLLPSIERDPNPASEGPSPVYARGRYPTGSIVSFLAFCLSPELDYTLSTEKSLARGRWS